MFQKIYMAILDKMAIQFGIQEDHSLDTHVPQFVGFLHKR